MRWVKSVVRVVSDLGLTTRFSLISLVILFFSMLIVGTWLTQRIESATIQRSSQLTGTYMQILMGPHLHSLEGSNWQGDAAIDALDAHFRDPAVLDSVPVVKVWLPDGTIVYSNNRDLIGRQYAVDDELQRALRGEVVNHISELDAEENVYERQLASRLMEVYVPVRRRGEGPVYAVAEFYISVEPLEASIDAVRLQTWGVLTAAAGLIYVLLVGMVRQASRTMRRQRDRLQAYAVRLKHLLRQNRRMHDRVVMAGANATAINEQYLQRVSADLHDGACQELALVLLRLDELRERCGECRLDSASAGCSRGEKFDAMEMSLQSALQDMRSLCKELRLSAIDTASIEETVRRAVRDYQRKSGADVDVTWQGDDLDAPASVKITLYRVIQEALMNGFQHAGGTGQRVRVDVSARHVVVAVDDDGPGFCVKEAMNSSGRLGLLGMRDRVQLLGGEFECVSARGRGSTIRATLPRLLPEGPHG